MIRTLTLRNYRGFEEYQIRELARVNLLVGPNNCGKTTVLEAVELLASGGRPQAMLKSSSRRAESRPHRSAAGTETRYAVRHHFRDHQVVSGVSFGISSDDRLGRIEFLVREASEEDPPGMFESEIPDSDVPPSMQPMVLELRRNRGADLGEGSQVFPLMDDGSLDWRSPRLRRFGRDSPGEDVPVRFIATDLGWPLPLGTAWNQVAMEGRDREVEDAMRIIAPELGSIRPLADQDRGLHSGFVVGERRGGPRVPIGSYGEGMRRMLALSLSLVGAAGGFLLVDEIDTGLHWTVMENLWKLIVESATLSSTQVFATTHSLDCILGLARLLDTRPDLRDGVSIQKLERSLACSVPFDAKSILAAADLDIELR